MRAYLVVTAESGKSRDIARQISTLPGVKMADACWGVGDVYAVLEFSAWKELNEVVLTKIHSMSGVIRTETHVAVEE
jgi:DNA-binding Lrp family transcriptional regulator